ncbi:MAG: hypothetical protein ACM4AI_01580, partial [Acidobacteriota bacterium]
MNGERVPVPQRNLVTGRVLDLRPPGAERQRHQVGGTDERIEPLDVFERDAGALRVLAPQPCHLVEEYAPSGVHAEPAVDVDSVLGHERG